MSDQNKFVNAYIDASVGTLHEFLGQILQSKAQLKVATESIASLQAELASARSELEKNKTDKTEKDTAVQKATNLEHTNHALQNKLAHLETALNQITEMKKVLVQKDVANAALQTQIESLKAEIIQKEAEVEEAKTSKKVINRKRIVVKPNEDIPDVIHVPDVLQSEPVKIDDF